MSHLAAKYLARLYGRFAVVCMDKNGRSLSKGCVKALISSGEVSQAE